MSVRRRNKNWKPLIPGFWPMVATLLLLAAIFGFYAALGFLTTLEKRAAPAAPPASQPAK